MGKNRSRSNRLWCAVVAALAVVAVGAAADMTAAAPARKSAATPGTAASRDRAATLQYLRAKLSYEKAVVAAAPASREAVEALADRLGSECPNLATGIKEMFRSAIGKLQSLPYQRREAEDHRRQQWDHLTTEERWTVGLTRSGPYRQAALAFAKTVESLRWSDRDVTAFEHANAQAMEWEVNGGTPLPVCADIEAWVQSGYTTLSPTTEAFVHARDVADRPLDRVIARTSFAAGFTNPLLRYEEWPRAKALARRIVDVTRRGSDALKRVFKASQHIVRLLGIVGESEARELEEISTAWKLTPRGDRAIDRGTSAAGDNYTVFLVNAPRHRRRSRLQRSFLEEIPAQGTCRHQIDIVEEQPLEDSSLTITREPHEACLSRSHPMTPRVLCDEELRTIEAQTLASARHVRVTLRDGHQIFSRVLRVPPPFGGPASFYYQAQLVWKSPPVSLTELDARGMRLRTVTLTHVPRCAEYWPYVKHA